MKQIPTKIFLLGFMGSGKSTLGKLLSLELAYRFIDLDEWIENRACLTVSEIFDQKGERYFRNMETESLVHLMQEEKVVVALGGGTPCFNGNMDLINQLGFSIFLDLPEKELAARLVKEKTQRPLIANLSSDELVGYIEGKLYERRPFYENADVHLHGLVEMPELIKVVKDKS